MTQNKSGTIFGVANKRSIAWASAQALAEAGARLVFTYQNKRLRENVEDLTKEWPGTLLLQCDVMNPREVEETFACVKEECGRLDFLVHSLAALARNAAPPMTEGGSIVSMSYYGAEKVVQNYNVMGVAKAGLEAARSELEQIRDHSHD